MHTKFKITDRVEWNSKLIEVTFVVSVTIEHPIWLIKFCILTICENNCKKMVNFSFLLAFQIHFIKAKILPFKIC